MTKEQRDELRRLCDEGTLQPWRTSFSEVICIESTAFDFSIATLGEEHDYEDESEVEALKRDAYLIVAAVNSLPTLLDDLDRLEHKSEGLESRMRGLLATRDELDAGLRRIAARVLPREQVYGCGDHSVSLGWIVNELVERIEELEAKEQR